MAYTDIDKSDDYFNTKLYTGDGTSSRALTGLGFQPDMVWTKRRSTADNHHLFDSVRVVSSVPQRLFPNLTNAEDGNFGSLDSFDSDGFTVGSNVATNSSGETYVAWNWLAGGTASSNTDGSITSSVSANTTSGFSIVSYTGNGTADQSIGHGLGAVPKMIILKQRSGTEHWAVYHAGTTADKQLYLNLTNAEETTQFDAPPSSSLFYVDTNVMVNDNSQTYIAYCFAEKKGFSKFGSYTGNGSNDGTFVYTGFKPAFCIVKRTDGSADWNMYDNKRIGYNPLNYFVYPNSSSAEDTSNPQWFDLLSNGFQLRNTSTMANTSGGSYIYMAFAENPFVTSGGIPTTAR